MTTIAAWQLLPVQHKGRYGRSHRFGEGKQPPAPDAKPVAPSPRIEVCSIGLIQLAYRDPPAWCGLDEVRDDAGSKPNRKTLVSWPGWRAGCLSPRCPDEPGHMENVDLKGEL